MKKLAILLLLTLGIVFNASADGRIQSDTGTCHSPIKVDDDDSEIDLGCDNLSAQINRFTDADGNNRMAHGSYIGIYKVELGHGTMSPYMSVGKKYDIYVGGNALDSQKYPNYKKFSAAVCTLVRSNYEANNNSDDQNQTEYVTNDWNLSMEFIDARSDPYDKNKTIAYWQVSMHCRDAVEQ